MCRLIHEAMDAGACGWSAQVLGAKSIQRDYDGTPMITDLLSEHEILTFAKILADRDEGFIELAYQETGEEGRPLAEETNGSLKKSPRRRSGPSCTRPSPRTRCIPNNTANGSAGWKAAQSGDCASMARAPPGAAGSR